MHWQARVRLVASLVLGPALSLTVLSGTGCSGAASAVNVDAAPDTADASSESVDPDAAKRLAACTPFCDKNAGWHPGALCEDFQGKEAGAYFCRDQAPADQTCAQSCSDVLAAAPSAECRASWESFLWCLKDAPSYGDAVLGQYIACDGAI